MPSLPITLPPGAILTISLGNSVHAGQTLATLDTKGEHVVNLAKALQAPAHKITKLLKKAPGDMIMPGDILAVKKGFLGLSEETVQSQVAGKIDRFERDTGNLYITLQDPDDGSEHKNGAILSPIEGVVTLCNNDQIVIDTDKDVIVAESGIGETAEAELLFLPESRNEKEDELLIYALDARVSGKMIATTRIIRDVLVKAVGLEVAGIIGTAISEKDIEHLRSRNYTTPIVILSEEQYQRLKGWKDKRVYCNGEGKTILLLHV